MTPSGREYYTYAGPDGRAVRSRVEAWRVHSSSCEENGGLYVPYTEEGVGVGEGGVGEALMTPAPPTLFDICSPVGSESSTGRRRSGERLSELARRVSAAALSPAPHALPHGASFELQDLPDDQCGNPNCLVKSHNGKYAGVAGSQIRGLAVAVADQRSPLFLFFVLFFVLLVFCWFLVRRRDLGRLSPFVSFVVHLMPDHKQRLG